ncbi:MAG TPA: serine hydrolase, partial [Bryobacteraceae bacterium]|nr:serine hydrolase [Bryobacteraceae bacterium]
MQVRIACAGLAAGALLIAGTLVYSAQLPVFSGVGPDAQAYGAAEHFPLGPLATAFEKRYMVATFSHFDSLYPVHIVSPASHSWAFQRPAAVPELTYVHAGTHYSLKDYLAHMPVTGLLIAKDDQILFEGYQYARSDQDRFTSQSIAKTIVGMLVGVAASEHAITSTADPASKYVPELKDSAYGNATVLDLLHMSSGVTCPIEDQTSGTFSLQTLTHECKQAVPPGTRFRYSAADSQVLGLIVSRAVQMPLARYLQQKVWQNIGVESKATWTIDASGQELAFCCFNATLRDYGRFARLLAFDGAWNGKQLIPRQWLS